MLKAWGPAQTAADTTCPAAAAPVTVADYVYDNLDRLNTLTENLPVADGGNRVTQTVYNADDSVQILKKAVGTGIAQNYATYTYSNNGLPLTVKDAKNQLTTYQYDGHDRKLKTLYPDKVTAAPPRRPTSNRWPTTPTATSPACANVTVKALPWPTTTSTAC